MIPCEKCAKTYRTWFKENLNALKYDTLSNGPTEGFNNKIKVQKRVSYGIRRFERFRIRILFITQKQLNKMIGIWRSVFHANKQDICFKTSKHL